MKDVVIVSACRTAIGTFGGTLKDLGGWNIGKVAMKGAIDRAGIDPALIDDVRFGCCMEPVDTLNVTRVAALLAGIPEMLSQLGRRILRVEDNYGRSKPRRCHPLSYAGGTGGRSSIRRVPEGQGISPVLTVSGGR